MIAVSTGSWWRERLQKICSLALSQVLSQDRDHLRKMISVFLQYLLVAILAVAGRSRNAKPWSARRSCITPDGRQRNKHFLCTTRATALGNADALEMLARL
jgi:hypothetical protein